MAQLQATTIAGNLSVDTDAIVVDAGTNQVAINRLVSTVPAEDNIKLDVDGTIRGDFFIGDGSDLTNLFADEAAQLTSPNGENTLVATNSGFEFDINGLQVLDIDNSEASFDLGIVNVGGDVAADGKITVNADGATPVSFIGDANHTIRVRRADDTDFGNLVVGDLTVEGTTTIVNSTQVDIGEQFLLLNPDQDTESNPANLQSAGIRIERGTAADDASLLFDEGVDEWKAGIEGSELTIARHFDNGSGEGSALSDFENDLDLSAFGLDLTTDDIPEGSANLYFEEGRVFDALVSQLVAGTGIDLDVNAPGEEITFNVTLAGLDTDDLSEGSNNLYYTQARFDSAFANKDTDDLTEGVNNLYYTEARFDTALASKTTDDLAEGSGSLYFTEARVAAALDNQLIAGVGIDITEAGGQFTFDVTLAGLDTDDLAEGSNLYFTNQRVADALVEGDGITLQVDGSGVTTIVSDVAAVIDDITTDDVDEGSINLYFTEERVFDAVQAQLIAGNGIDATFDAVNDTYELEVNMGDFTSDDLVEGSTNLYFTDVRAVDAVEAASTLNLNDVNANNVTVNDLTVGGSVTITGTFSTDELDEGSTNLFFTDGRVFDALQAQLLAGNNVTFDVDALGETITINADAGDLASELTSDDIAEGSTNLYFTDQRAVDAVEAAATLTLNDVDAQNVSVQDLTVNGTVTIAGTLSTDELTEGTTNLFFTDERVFSALGNQLLAGDHIVFDVDAGAETITINADANSLVGDLTTDDLAEGSANLYFTEARSFDATEAFLTGGQGVTITRSGNDLTIETTLGDLDNEYIRNDGDTAAGDYDFNTGLFVLNQSANTITSDGDITTTGTLTAQEIVETSTIRVKENVKTMADQVRSFMKLRPVEFDWKEISDKKNDKGLIAEEVAEVYPEFVHLENGQATGVNYSKLTSVLINVVQDLNRKVSDLETQLARS